MPDEDSLGADLVAWGRAATLTTRGRVSGRPVTAVVGFIEEADGSLLVAAGDPDADWARNLEADPACLVTVGHLTFRAMAEPLVGPTAHAVVRDLILRYGTPAERLGRGPVFRIRPAAGDATESKDQPEARG